MWAVLSKADNVHVASGQKTLCFEPRDCDRDELVKKATGRTGNLRAPALKVGRDLYIGFNAGMYDNLLK